MSFLVLPNSFGLLTSPSNGRGGGITHPNPEAQELVIRQAFRNAGNLDQDLVGYFECHGTGTPVGDPLEVSAIGRVFSAGRQSERLLIGSVRLTCSQTIAEDFY